jgi:phosphoglycerate dehydrogenase-like enzyme
LDNLLLTEVAYQQVAPRLAPHSERLRVLRMQADGTLKLGDRTVTTAQLPVHLCWLSGDLIDSGSVAEFIGAVMQAEDLRWLQTVTAGLDHPLFKALFDRGVRLCNSDAQAPAIAEYVLASVLYRYQQFPDRVARQQAGQWQPNDFREIYGSHWLIIGFGNIGRRVGRIAQGFEARVTGVKRIAKPLPDADLIISFADLDGHIGAADVVVLACALTEETRGLLDARRLQAMKPGAVLVNIARGEVVDEAALVRVLDSGHLDYAVLDVFQQEPLPADSPIWQHPRVLLTPHSSNRGAGTPGRGLALFADNLDAYLAGRPLRNEVDATFF